MISFLVYFICLLAFFRRFLCPFGDYLKRVWIAFQLPGPSTTFPFGNCFTLRDPDVLKTEFANGYSLYGTFGRVWLLFFPVFVVLHPNDIQTILATKKHTEKLFLYKFLHNFLGKGMITSERQRWQWHRKYLQPYFHLGILEKFILSYERCAKIGLLDEVEGKKGAFNVAPMINKCVLSVLNETILGLNPDDSSDGIDQKSPFRDGKLQVPDRIRSPWLLFQSIYKLTKASANEMSQKERLESFTRKMINIRRTEIFKKSPCMLDYMLEISEQHPEFTEQDIIDEACTMMLAGQDSTGSALAFTMYYLATHPYYQEKCFTEIERIYQRKNFDEPLTLSDLNEMRFLEMCIKETLRLQPSIILYGRKLSEPVTLQNRTLPAGTDVFLIPYITHRIPEIYPEPEKFDPERFNPENTTNRSKFAFIPFSAGPRNCIGYQFAMMEMKVMMATLLRKYKLISVQDVTKIEPTFRITVRARGGIWLKMEKRT